MEHPSLEVQKVRLTCYPLIELIKIGDRKAERRARRKEKRERDFQARIDAIPAAPLGPEGQWPTFGPMRVVNGKAVGGFSVTYHPIPFEGPVKWEDDPLAQEAANLENKQRDEWQVEDRLKYWPWGQAVPRMLVTLVRPDLQGSLRD